MKNLHSFAIPAYKNSEYLELCIESLLNQTLKSDIFITTSTPSDFIKAMADKYDLPLFVNDTKPGISSDWNFALSKAKTKYITLAHQDDIYLPEYTKKCVDAAERKNDSSLIFTDYEELRGSRVVRYSLLLLMKRVLLFPFLLTNTLRSSFLKRLSLSFGSSICCPTAMINREQNPDFLFSSEYSNNLDWFGWYTLAQKPGSFIYIKKILVGHRIHDKSETTNCINDNRRYEEDKRMFDLLLPSFFSKIIMFFYKYSYKSNKS